MATATSSILQLIHQIAEGPQVQGLPDRDLLQRFHSQHDTAAFAALLRRHGAMVLDVCRGVLGDGPDAEDAFQATFLVLARKAGSVRKAAALGSWLHGVAHRTALKARVRSAARQRHEARAPQRQAAEADELSWREVRQVLHEELSGLPECYREPLLLCYLEGATHQRAAARLGLAERTVRDRLERGRGLLRARLVRRGLGPAALLLATAWPAALAAAPPALVTATAHGAALVAAGQGAAGVVISSKVIALSQEVLKNMVPIGLKHLALVLLCSSAFIGAVTVKSGSAAGGEGAAPGLTDTALATAPAQAKPVASDAATAGGGLAAEKPAAGDEPAPRLRKTKPGVGPGGGFGVGGAGAAVAPAKVKHAAGDEPAAIRPLKTKPGAGPGFGHGAGGKARRAGQ